MRRRARLILNPTAAAGVDLQGRVQNFVTRLKALGWEVEVCPTRYSGHAVALAQAATDCDCLIAGGGDGTVREVVTGLVTRFPDVTAPHPIPVPVAVLPFGTGNDVARLLGVYEDEQVLAAMQLGQTERWDVLDVESRTTEGEWEHHYALLFVACGFAGDLLRHTTPWVKRVFGSRLAYPVGFMRGLMRFRPFQMRIRTVDREWKGEWVVALAANAPMAGGGTMQIAPGALPGDGKIHVSLIQAVTRWELFRQFERFVRGRHIGHRKVEYFATDNLEVAAEPPVAVAADGDLLGCSPMRVQLLRGRVQFYSRNRV